MFKFVSGVLIGVFAGAFTFEVIKRLKPEMAKSTEQKAKELADRLFMEKRKLSDF